MVELRVDMGSTVNGRWGDGRWNRNIRFYFWGSWKLLRFDSGFLDLPCIFCDPLMGQMKRISAVSSVISSFRV